MIRLRYESLILIFLMLCIYAAPGPFLYLATAQDSTAVELRDGVIIDLSHNVAYVMNPKGGIDAVDLEKGIQTWSTDEADKPLAVSDNLLVSQAETGNSKNDLKIVVLTIQERGQPIFADSIKLADNVLVGIDNTLNSSFITRAKVLENDVFISWQYSFRQVKGFAFLDTTLVDVEAELPKNIKGTIRVNLRARTISALDSTEVPAGLDPRPPDLSNEERLSGVSGIQFISANGQHVLSSTRIADDRQWDKYTWTIYNRANGERVAEIKNYLSYAPFSVLDSQIIFETGPYMRRTANGLLDEPLKIRAVDLQTGKEIWSWKVRDTAYRGSFPP